MDNRLEYKLRQYKNTLNNFEESLSIQIDELPWEIADSVKSGRVQKFKFCTELLWKTLKVYLWEVNGIDSKSPKLVIKDYFALGFLTSEEYEAVMGILDDRNMLSHIYNNEQFEVIYNRVLLTLPLFKKILGHLES